MFQPADDDAVWQQVPNDATLHELHSGYQTHVDDDSKKTDDGCGDQRDQES